MSLFNDVQMYKLFNDKKPIIHLGMNFANELFKNQYIYDRFLQKNKDNYFNLWGCKAIVSNFDNGYYLERDIE